MDVIRILYLAFKKESLLPKQDLKLGPSGLKWCFLCEKIQDKRCHNLL